MNIPPFSSLGFRIDRKSIAQEYDSFVSGFSVLFSKMGKKEDNGKKVPFSFASVLKNQGG